MASSADLDQDLAVAHIFSLGLSNDRLFANAIDAATTVQHPLVKGEPFHGKLLIDITMQPKIHSRAMNQPYHSSSC